MCIFLKALRSLALKKKLTHEPSVYQGHLTHNHFIKPLTVLETILSWNTTGKMYLVFSGTFYMHHSHLILMCLKQVFMRKKAPPNNQWEMNPVYITRVHSIGEQRAGRQPYFPDVALASGTLTRREICQADTLDPSQLTIARSPPCSALKNTGNICIKVRMCLCAQKTKPYYFLRGTRS